MIALLDAHRAQVARRIADLERQELYLSELRSCAPGGWSRHQPLPGRHLRELAEAHREAIEATARL